MRQHVFSQEYLREGIAYANLSSLRENEWVNTWGTEKRVCKSKTGRCLGLRAAVFHKEWGKLMGYNTGLLLGLWQCSPASVSFLRYSRCDGQNDHLTDCPEDPLALLEQLS